MPATKVKVVSRDQREGLKYRLKRLEMAAIQMNRVITQKGCVNYKYV